jgi:hypothetical protein
MTAITAALGAVTQVGHPGIAVVAVIGALVARELIAATAKIIEAWSQPEIQRVRTLRRAHRKAESAEERDRALLYMMAGEDRRSVMQILKQRLGQPLSGGEKGVVRPASTDGVTQMPGKGKPAA